MRLFCKALLREMSSTGGIALSALSAIVLVTLLVRMLGKTAVGDVEGMAVLPFIVFGYLYFLPVLLSLALYLGVFLTLTRYWQDSEMVIWSCAGVGPVDWIRPVLQFALPITLLIAFLSLVINPWAAQKRAEYERYLSSREQISSLTPGVFTETRDNRVYFVESLIESGPSVKNVFIQSEQHGRLGVVVAREGHVETQANGDRFLILENGRRYEGLPGAADYKVMEFQRHGFRLEPSQAQMGRIKPRMRSTFELLGEPNAENLAEVVQRLGYPISALLLALLAIPLSYHNPRASRSYSILFAMLSYTLYNNIIGLSETWVAQGKISALTSMAGVHGAALAILLVAFWLRYGSPGRKV